MHAEPISYDINANDQITAVSDSWAPFAVANDAPHLAAGVIGRSIWEFVSGVTTRQLYHELFSRVRTGRTVSFAYRCDSPGLRRFMQMTITARPASGMRFESLTLRVEPRDPPVILGVAQSPAGAPLVVCSWCKAVEVADAWEEIEVAVERLKLFGGGSPVELTHAICPQCASRFDLELDAL